MVPLLHRLSWQVSHFIFVTEVRYRSASQKCVKCTCKRALISNKKNHCCWNFFLLTYLIGLINGNSAEYDAMILSANDTSSSNNVSLIFKRFNISENSNLFKQGRELNTLAIAKRKNEITCNANRIFMSFFPRNLVDFNSVILKACV